MGEPMNIGITEICERLKLYLGLCKEYVGLNRIASRSDRYIIRYLVVVLRAAIFSNDLLRVEVEKRCSREVVNKLDDLGRNFLIAKYGHADDFTVLELIKHLCSCLDWVTEWCRQHSFHSL